MTNKETNTQWVSFSLGDETFACKIKKIQEIIPYQEPIPVPGSPTEIEGVLNVRGEIIPVVSGQQIANIEKKITQPEDSEESGSTIILESELGHIVNDNVKLNH